MKTRFQAHFFFFLMISFASTQQDKTPLKHSEILSSPPLLLKYSGSHSKSGTGMRSVGLDGRRECPIDNGECINFLKVSRLSCFYPRSL